MVAVNKLVMFSIKNHVWFLSFLIILQFTVGAYTEWYAEKLNLGLRTVIDAHKLNGQMLALTAVFLAIEGTYMTLAKLPRAPINNSLVNFSIRNHWMFMVVLLPAQYMTTVMAKETAAFTGLSVDTVFGLHGWFALAIVINAISLLVEKLLLPFVTGKTAKLSG